MSEVPPGLKNLVGLLHPERYTVYVAPDIDRDWVASQLPDGVEVLTHKYLKEGALVVFPTRKIFRLPPVPTTAAAPGEAEEPHDEQDTGHDPEQRGHSQADPEEDKDEDQDEQ
jgi:hypothetical protein